MIYILHLVPLFIGIFFYFKLILTFLREHHKAHYICQRTLLQLEFDVLYHLKKLFLLNPEAKRLQLKRKDAEIKRKLALQSGEPLLIAEATRYLVQVKREQKQFNEKQKFHIRRANRLMDSGLNKILKAFRAHQIRDLLSFSYLKNKLAVQAWPLVSLSPIYRPKENFTKEQALIMKWKINLKSLVKEELNWLKPFLPKHFLLKGQCGASLIRRKQIWTSTLIEVNAY